MARRESVGSEVHVVYASMYNYQFKAEQVIMRRCRADCCLTKLLEVKIRTRLMELKTTDKKEKCEQNATKNSGKGSGGGEGRRGGGYLCRRGFLAI